MAQKKKADLPSLEQALGAAKTDKDKAEAGLAIARYYLDKNDANCVTYAQSAIKPANKAKMELTEAALHNVIGTYYFENKNYKKAIASLESEYLIRKKNQQARPRAATCFNLGFCYAQQKNFKKAKKYYDESWELAKKLGDKELTERLTRVLCDVAVADKDYKKAYEYLNTYLQADNKRLRADNAKLISINEEQEQIIVQQDSTISEVTLQKELLEKDKELLEAQKLIDEQTIELQEQKYMEERQAKELAELAKGNAEKDKLIMLIVSVFVALAAIAAVMGFISKRKANKVLADKNSLISRQNENINNMNGEILRQNEEISKNLAEIATKNKDITDSINYAGKIQKALLHTFDACGDVMNDYFVFYEPKDIVSGDFYWAHKTDHKFVFAVGDCTGHSVPGAFMSMLGISLLNQVVAQQNVFKASEVLEKMRSMVKSYLGQTGIDNEPKDGMDMAICIWDLDTNEVNFSGAYNPMVFVSKGAMKVMNAAKCPVGIHMREQPFTDEYFKVDEGDRMYLFSDGFSDQFGAVSHEKYKMARFRQLLLDTSLQPMQEQYQAIRKAYYDWKGDFIQIDDVCVLGVEV